MITIMINGFLGTAGESIQLSLQTDESVNQSVPRVAFHLKKEKKRARVSRRVSYFIALFSKTSQ